MAKSDSARLPIEPLQCGFAVHYGNDDIPVVSARLWTYQCQITVAYTGVDHGVATDLDEELAAVEPHPVQGHVPCNILYRRCERPGLDSADDRKKDRFTGWCC